MAYDPCVPEALEMFERMNNVHKREIYRSRLLWKPFKDEAGNFIQLVPVCDILYKF